MERKLDFTHEVTVPEMLAARDHRVEQQRDFIARFHHPVICFMLNIPGPHKVGEDFYWAFETGLQRIGHSLDQNGIRIEAEGRRGDRICVLRFRGCGGDPCEGTHVSHRGCGPARTHLRHRRHSEGWTEGEPRGVRHATAEVPHV